MTETNNETVFNELHHWYTPFEIVMHHIGIPNYQERIVQDIPLLSTAELQRLKEDLEQFRDILQILYI